LGGLALIVVGIVCLYLSDALAQGWWQGTLEAFGVGFVVGGVVDVMTIPALSQIIVGEQRRQEVNNKARDIVMPGEDPIKTGRRAKIFLLQYRDLSPVDRDLRKQLREWADWFDTQEVSDADKLPEIIQIMSFRKRRWKFPWKTRHPKFSKREPEADTSL
jgi:hypothetical protein